MIEIVHYRGSDPMKFTGYVSYTASGVGNSLDDARYGYHIGCVKPNYPVPVVYADKTNPVHWICLIADMWSNWEDFI